MGREGRRERGGCAAGKKAGNALVWCSNLVLFQWYVLSELIIG